MKRPAFLLALPNHVAGLMHEISRHLLRRPVVGICAVARTEEGRVLLVRRADTGGWALPGGTLEWNETLATALPREIEEETGAKVLGLGRISGVYSRPDRDWRFHAVTICVEARVAEPIRGAKNALEIREVALFAVDALPPLTLGMQDMLDAALKGGDATLE